MGVRLLVPLGRREWPPGGTPGPRERRGPGGGPAAAMVGSLPAAENPHVCSGKSVVSGLCACRCPG